MKEYFYHFTITLPKDKEDDKSVYCLNKLNYCHSSWHIFCPFYGVSLVIITSPFLCIAYSLSLNDQVLNLITLSDVSKGK